MQDQQWNKHQDATNKVHSIVINLHLMSCLTTYYYFTTEYKAGQHNGQVVYLIFNETEIQLYGECQANVYFYANFNAVQ